MWKSDPSFEQNLIPLTQGCFVPSFVDIGPVVLEKNIRMSNLQGLRKIGDLKIFSIAQSIFNSIKSSKNFTIQNV